MPKPKLMRATLSKPLPAPNSDFYMLAETLPPDELAVVKQVRAFMEAKAAPIVTKYWAEDSFPFELIPAFKDLNLGGLGMQGYGCRGGSGLLLGLAMMEMARVDASIATFFGVHDGLAMGSIYLAGSEAQKQKWLPPMARFEKIGCFGLTEPLVGSGASWASPKTTAKREGDTLGPQRPRRSGSETRALVRRLDHLGEGPRRQSGQGFYRREQDHARVQRRKDSEQDRAENRPERPDHAQGRPCA